MNITVDKKFNNKFKKFVKTNKRAQEKISNS